MHNNLSKQLYYMWSNQKYKTFHHKTIESKLPMEHEVFLLHIDKNLIMLAKIHLAILLTSSKGYLDIFYIFLKKFQIPQY